MRPLDTLPDLPTRWRPTRLKFSLLPGKSGCKIGPFGSALKLETLSEKGYPVYGQENVMRRDYGLGKRFIDQQRFDQMSQYTVRPGDMLITMMGSAGRCDIVPPGTESGIIDSHLLRLRLSRTVYPNFVRWFLDESATASAQTDLMSNGSIMDGLNSTIVKNSWIPIPPLPTQKAIADFLDRKTAAIDALIEKKQKLLDLLAEKRAALINQAVTKGLDPTVPMKDSGIPWIGEIPAHWEVGALSYTLDAVGDVDHYMPSSVEDGVPYVMTGDLKKLASEIDFGRCKQIAHDDYLRLGRKIRPTKGDLIMARYATIGTVSYVDLDAEFLVSYSCVTIKPNAEKALGRYLFFCLKSDPFVQGIQERVNTNTQGNVGIADLRKVKVVLPPLSEQQRIANHLTVECDRCEEVRRLEERQIGLLLEYRQALITAAVTGQLEIPEEAA